MDKDDLLENTGRRASLLAGQAKKQAYQKKPEFPWVPLATVIHIIVGMDGKRS